jgi:hypothetical protein
MNYTVDNQSLLDAIQSENPISLDGELAVLRYLLQTELDSGNKRSARLCADLANQITRTSGAVEQSLIRQRHLIPKQDVIRIMATICRIVSDELLSLPIELRVKIVDNIVARVRAEAARELEPENKSNKLLEVDNNDRTHDRTHDRRREVARNDRPTL